MGPERACGFVAVDPAQGFNGIKANLRLAGVEQGGDRRDQSRVGNDGAGIGECEGFLPVLGLCPGFQ